MKQNNHSLLLLLAVLSVLLAACNEKGKLPTVTTGKYTAFTGSKTVQCEGYVVTDGGDPVVDRGICYMPGTGTPTISNQHVGAGSGKGSFAAVLQNIEQGNYTYRAYATNSIGIAYGDLAAFTMPSQGGSGGGSGNGENKYTLSDFVGSYSCHAYNWDYEKYEDWTDVTITAFEDENIPSAVVVEGLYMGYSFFAAIGQFDADKQCIRLLSSWYLTDHTFQFTGNDTVYVASFYPVYAPKDATSFHWIYNGGGFEGYGEAWLTFDANGKLNFGPSDTPDSDSKYANGMCWRYHASDNPSESVGRLAVHIEITLTKTSSAAKPSRDVHALIWRHKQQQKAFEDNKIRIPVSHSNIKKVK